jgi:hypothetical protein
MVYHNKFVLNLMKEKEKKEQESPTPKKLKVIPKLKKK